MGYAGSVLRYASRVLKAYNAVERDEADFQDDCGEEYDPLFETRDGLPTIIK